MKRDLPQLNRTNWLVPVMQQVQVLHLHFNIQHPFGKEFRPWSNPGEWFYPLATAITIGCTKNPTTTVHVTLGLTEWNPPEVNSSTYPLWTDPRVPLYQGIVRRFRANPLTNLWVRIVGIPDYVPRGDVVTPHVVW
jgi:hypothetical protein